MQKNKYPLHRYAKIQTRRPDEFEEALSRVFGATLVSLPNPSALNVCANFIELNDIAIGFAISGTVLTAHFEEAGYARLQIPLRGNGVTTCGSHSISVGPHKPCVVSHGRSSSLKYGANLENLFVRVKPEALERALALLVGRPFNKRLEFELNAFTSPAMLRGERRLVESLVQLLDDETSQVSPNALRELEDAVVAQLLYAASHNFSLMLERDPSDTTPAIVRRVEAYVGENWRLPITIETLVEISGVSARTLFRTFAKARGISPILFLRATRLNQARALLRRPEADTTVTGVALSCGFSNVGQFAIDYRKAFGELPSFTLRKYRPK